jgi:biopolymer transport protein ExbD
MAFNLGEENEQGINEMNLIPLIDIMLVLMIIFLVTATVINPGVPLTLPKTEASQLQLPPETVTISVDAQGQISWNQDKVTLQQLDERMAQAALQAKKPALQLRADKNVKYDAVAQVMARASKAGLTDLAFVSDAQPQ